MMIYHQLYRQQPVLIKLQMEMMKIHRQHINNKRNIRLNRQIYKIVKVEDNRKNKNANQYVLYQEIHRHRVIVDFQRICPLKIRILKKSKFHNKKQMNEFFFVNI